MNWQRANIQAAAAFVRERMTAGGGDARTKAVHEGLLDVLDPTRRTARLQREAAESAKAAVVVQAARDRRNRIDRRGRHDRRLVNLGAPGGSERRAHRERREGSDRRT